MKQPRAAPSYRAARRNAARTDRTLRYWRLRRRTMKGSTNTQTVSAS